MREVIATEGAFRGVGPFSQAIRANGLVFVSGQIGVDPRTDELVSGGIAAQADRALQTLSAILEAAGTGLDRVVRCGVFLKDMNDFSRMNEVFARYFPSEPPARTTVEVARLPLDVLVEIDAIALARDEGEGR
ncbi:MAG: RidA family protein [Acidobacteriota bacterium]